MKRNIMILTIIVFISLALVGVYYYFGGFYPIKFKVMEQGGETLVYENIVGDYKQSAIVMDTIYDALLLKENIKTTKGFGIYYDNPQKVEENMLRSEAGCILDSVDSIQVETLSKKYKIKVFPRSTYICAEFPYKGKISTIISIMKVYPALHKYIKHQGFNEQGAIMEIYDIPNGKILFRKEITSK